MASSCFTGRGFVQGQNESTVAQREADCRGEGSHLGVDMELNSLGWALWRRTRALREKARKSVLAPQNKNMFTKFGPTNNHYEPRVSYCPLCLVDLYAHCLPLLSQAVSRTVHIASPFLIREVERKAYGPGGLPFI